MISVPEKEEVLVLVEEQEQEEEKEKEEEWVLDSVGTRWGRYLTRN